ETRAQSCLRWAKQVLVEGMIGSGETKDAAEAQAALLTEDRACRSLSTILMRFHVDALKLTEDAQHRARAEKLVTPADVQPLMGPAAVAQWTATQPGASPSSLPTPLAATNVGLAGTAQGPQAVVTLAVNPLSLFAESTKALAQTSRAGDLSVTVPV